MRPEVSSHMTININTIQILIVPLGQILRKIQGVTQMGTLNTVRTSVAPYSFLKNWKENPW